MSELQDLVNEAGDNLWCGEGREGNLFPEMWATLHFDMRLLTSEQQEKIWQACHLLKEAGIAFDTGFGGGTLDWELDWSLGGASLQVRPLRCMNGDLHKERMTVERRDALWAIWHMPDGNTVSYPYCSVDCLEQSKCGRLDWKLVMSTQEVEKPQ